MRFLIRTLVTAFALWVAVLLVSGIEVTGSSTWRNVLTLLAVAVIFGVVNAILKPLIKLFGCCLYIVTLGLIAFVVNALLFMLVGWLADKLNLPFQVEGFWSAFWGAIIVGVISWIVNLVIPDPKPEYTEPPPPPPDRY
ncbi:MAG TPA: phage holin family protein [Micromonosporaceae bacterium]|nr:phage holin family protein [Micromonosporaceae bacterium]